MAFGFFKLKTILNIISKLCYRGMIFARLSSPTASVQMCFLPQIVLTTSGFMLTSRNVIKYECTYVRVTVRFRCE